MTHTDNQFRAARTAANLSQQQLAARSGVNIRQIQRIESGEILPENLTARTLFLLADALHVDARDLLQPTTLAEAYGRKYGPAAKNYLRSLGGDPDAIIARVQDAWNAPDPVTDWLTQCSQAHMFTNSTDAAVAAHAEIIKDIERRYFSQFSRESAVLIANALGGQGILCLCPTEDDLTYTCHTFTAKWNEINPDLPPIRPVPGLSN